MVQHLRTIRPESLTRPRWKSGIQVLPLEGSPSWTVERKMTQLDTRKIIRTTIPIPPLRDMTFMNTLRYL